MIHPFHPLSGREFSLLHCRFNWGQQRVHLRVDEDDFISLPASWTDVVPSDPFVAVSAGRSAFRPGELVELAALIDRLQRDRSAAPADSAKEILPDM